MDMDEQEFLELIAERGLAIDEGCLIGGPFIPDGRVRLYEQDTHTVIYEAASLEELMAQYF